MASPALVNYDITPWTDAQVDGWTPVEMADIDDAASNDPVSVDIKFKLGPMQSMIEAMRRKVGNVPVRVYRELGAGDVGPGPVTVIGYDAGLDAWSIAPASPNAVSTLADLVLLTTLNDDGATIGRAYQRGRFGSTLETDGGGVTIGDPVYLSGSGTVSLNLPQTGIPQVVGFVASIAAAADIDGYIKPPDYSLAATQIVTKTADYTVTRADQHKTILVDATSGAKTITLPAAFSCTGLVVTIKKIDVSANTVTLDALIDGQLTQVILDQWESLTIHCDGSAWYII